ncbi:MAG TPA: hypothetical protein VFJ94_05045 [Intrasporangium sp.]|uniref:ATP-grasp domain-containing protein n=1 Tax=Intrasporangium sp. TaxID=1925024 RepID=UPI002D788D86|nr:hypothetical protein [Intrasporangium sp.]HET7397869.1 hypothetical protein [Intrasporangium sp.]
MTTAARPRKPLAGVRVGLLERPDSPGRPGALVDALVPALRAARADVRLVHAEEGHHRVDAAPPWDVVVLKSGSAAALHLAAAAEGWGVPCVNSAAATGLARDKVAVALLLQGAGLPVARSWAAWLGRGPGESGGHGGGEGAGDQLDALAGRPLVVKAARGSRGEEVWSVPAGGLRAVASRLPPGPYLVMEAVPHAGDDLKAYVAGDWLTAIERPFPARTLAAKVGRPVSLPAGVADVVRAAGALLGLTCFGVDFVRGPQGWVVVDVNAFPGYKGAEGAAEAIVSELARSLA